LITKPNNAKNDNHKSKIGGQALFEGVMMRGVTQEAMAVRKKDGSIYVECKTLPPKRWYQKAVFVRGVFNFVLQLKNGYSYMMKSMEVSGLLDEDEDDTDAHKQLTVDNEPPTNELLTAAESGTVAAEVAVVESESVVPEVETPPEMQPVFEIVAAPEEVVANVSEKSKSGVLEMLVGVLGIVGGVGLGVLLFMFVPTYGVSLLNDLVAGDLEDYRSLIEGVVRIILFVLYMWAISFMREIRVTYRYHGAEHKAIAAFEAGEPLDGDNPECIEKIKSYTRFHPRCGTSFIFLVLAISILIYSVLSIPGMPMNVETISTVLAITPWWANAVRIAIQILSTPFIVAVTYELIKLAGRYDKNIFMRALSVPGLALQRLTVFEPTDEQIQVAVAALLPVLPKTEEEKTEDKW
jgi:uncharacterized protein YqhQ